MHLKTKGMGEAFKKKTTHVLIIFAVVGKASSSTHILFISLWVSSLNLKQAKVLVNIFNYCKF